MVFLSADEAQGPVRGDFDGDWIGRKVMERDRFTFAEVVVDEEGWEGANAEG